MKTMTSVGKMKCQASHTTRKMPDPGSEMHWRVKKNELVQFQFSRCLAKEPITKAEVLNSVFKDYQDHFLVVLGQASEYLQLVFGLR